MAEIFKKDMLRLWAETGDIVPPTDEKISTGWAVEVVPRQWWNWMQNRVDTNVAYMLQKGIPEWDGTTEYIAGKSYVQHNNVIYKSIQTGTNQNPAKATTYWKKALVESSASMEAIKTVVPSANTIAYFTGATTAASTSLTSFARTLLGAADAATARGTLGAQQVNTALTAISDVTPAADTIAYFNGTTTAASTSLSSFGRTLIDDLTAAAARTTLELNNVANVLQAPSTRVLTAGNGLTGGGDLSADRTFTLGTPSTLTTSTTNAVTATSHTHAVTFPVTSVAGKTGAVTLAKADVGLGNVTNDAQLKIASNLSDLNSAATARTNLGLSTGATATVTTSSDDTTAGRLLKVGDFGLGGVVPLLSDLDVLSGVNRFFGVQSNATGSPTGGGGGVGILSSYFTERDWQLVSAISSNRVYTRTRISASWSAWREIYHQGSILGTVSQSSGVPTGAIIERGSNANGAYVRFADGTQICTVTQTHAGLAVANAFGGGFISNSLSWTFPATFVGQPFATFFGRGPVRLMWPMADQPPASGVVSYYLASSASQAAADVVIRGAAIGRWF